MTHQRAIFVVAGAMTWLSALSTVGPKRCEASQAPANATPSPPAPPSDSADSNDKADRVVERDPATAAKGSSPPPTEEASEDLRNSAEQRRATQARSLFEAGAKAFADRQNASAIVYFQRAQALLPNSKLTYNIGLAYEDMGDLTNAIFHYLSYLHQQPQSGERDEVLSRIRRLEEQLAVSGVQHLSVTTDPPGALVLVDNTPRGVTPFAAHLPPGAHQLRLIQDGFQTRETTVHLQADRAFEVRLSLQPNAPLPAARERALRPITWTLLSVGAGGLLGGVLFEAARGNARDDARDAPDPAAAAHFAGAAQAHQLASLSSFGVGVALLAAGSLFAYEDLREEQAVQTIGPLGLQLPCTGYYCGIVASGTF